MLSHVRTLLLLATDREIYGRDMELTAIGSGHWRSREFRSLRFCACDPCYPFGRIECLDRVGVVLKSSVFCATG